MQVTLEAKVPKHSQANNVHVDKGECFTVHIPKTGNPSQQNLATLVNGQYRNQVMNQLKGHGCNMSPNEILAHFTIRK